MENDKSVQWTNDSSILSKFSMIKLGYFDDPVLNHFVLKKKSRRSSLINRGYYIRAKAVEFVVDLFIDKFKKDFQVLSLGAGFDSLFFRLKNNNKWPNNSVYYEVDFLQVVERKKQIIVNLPNFMSYLELKNVEINNENIILNSENYKLLGINLCDIKKLEKVLEICGMSNSKPTFVLFECVRTYLDSKSSFNLISWVNKKFQTVVLASYEQMYGDDGFGLIMLNHFSSLNSPLLSIHQSNYENLKEFYSNLDWDEVNILNINNFYNEFINEDEKRRIKDIEPFDEYEEWHLKCSHYILVYLSKGIDDFNTFPISPILTIDRNKFNWDFSDYFTNIKRFSHCSVLISNEIMSIGGFGVENGAHKRLTTVNILNLNERNTRSVNLTDEILGTRLFAQTILLDSDRVLVIGGRSSPIKCPETVIILTKSEQNDSINSKTVNCNGEKPCERWRHSASLVTIDGTEFVIVFGGKSITLEFLDDCYALNTKTWTWKKIKETDSSPTPRHSHSSVSWNDELIITCGLGRSYNPLNSIHILNCINLQWRSVNVNGLLPRYSHTSHVWLNKLFLVGGVNCEPECLPGIAIISLDSWNCVEYCLPTLTRDKPVLLHNHSSVLDEENDSIIIIGGGGNCFSFGTHFNNDIITIDLDQFSQ